MIQSPTVFGLPKLNTGHGSTALKLGSGAITPERTSARKPMRDNNVLTRFLKPAARKIGLGFVNWRSLRTSRATWMIEAGANPKDVQGQMRHSRIQTTLDIYAQFVPESQRRAVEQTSKMASERIAHAH